MSVTYGDRRAVDGISLTVEPGEVLAVLGPSGCGKSSLLRAVAGLEPLAGGAVRVDGLDLAGVPVHRRGIGLMFQEHALFPHRDVAGNVGFGLRMAGWDRDRIADRVTELLDLVGLDGRGDDRVDQLSGGERQRVALARTLAPAPGLVLLDEPLGSLDRALRERLLDDLGDIVARLGTTVVIVTHDQTEAFALADRVAVLREGHLVRVDPPRVLWSDPGSPWLARFLGLANVVDGSAFGRSGTVLVRPDRLRLANIGDGLAGRVVGVGFRGDRSVVRVATAAGELTVWAPVEVDVALDGAVNVGGVDDAITSLDGPD
ncbi:MAG: ABC transporter ATP-binding protein [Actinomycetota bacterium]